MRDIRTVNTAATATPPVSAPDALRPWDPTYDRSEDTRLKGKSQAWCTYMALKILREARP